MPSTSARARSGLCEAPARSCTCRGCFCSRAGRGVGGERAKPRPVRINPVGDREGRRGELRGALSGVTDSSLRLPVHSTDQVTRAGRGTENRGNAPRREGTPPRPSPQISPARPAASFSFCTAVGSLSLAGTRPQQPLPRKPTSLSTPRPCPQGVSLSTKNNPLLCLRVYHLIRLPLTAPPPASPAARLLRPKIESSQPSALRVSTSPLEV